MISDIEFAKQHKVRQTTVKGWYDKGYLPGSIYDEKSKTLKIPQDTLCPYSPRAEEPSAVYVSIIKACCQNRSVFAKMYNIPEIRFEMYLKELAQVGFINPYLTKHGFRQFTPTLKGEEFMKLGEKARLKAISAIVEAAAKGVTAAALDKFFPTI